MSDLVDVRPMLPADVPAAQESSYTSLREAGLRYGWQMPELDDAGRVRGRLRVAHLQRTDPAGAWVAERAGTVVGVALALRREGLWFLSLLTVDPGLQGAGTGGRLLSAALGTYEGATSGLIMASSDPKALRRYAGAGFALLPGYDATGTIDRSLLPAVTGVREGDWSADAERVDDLGRQLRGAPYGPDLGVLEQSGARLLMAEAGFAVVGAGGLALLGARDPRVAQSLLWAALAEADGEVELSPLTGDQQWAVEVALQARLTVRPGASLCVRGELGTRGRLGPLTPYLLSGAYG